MADKKTTMPPHVLTGPAFGGDLFDPAGRVDTSTGTGDVMIRRPTKKSRPKAAKTPPPKPR